MVLIIAPTREGAFQIYNTICAIGSEVEDLKCECFIGGFSYAEDVPKACKCNIAVGTPGRLLHLIENEKLKIDTIRLFIIDDFDELLIKPLKPEVSEIFHILPEKKQTVVASLTCTDEVMELTSEFLKQPFQACYNENELSLLGMAHYYYIVPVNWMPLLSYRRKLEVLKSILFRVKFSQCVIFCNSVHRIEPLCIDIRMLGFSVVSMSKAKDQVERLQAVELLKRNKCKVLVSTDVSSRGIDAENVDLVINFDMPFTCRGYLHRCGRAGRYGSKCSSITFLLKNQTDQFDKIENEGYFNSYALPEPIPEDLHYDINPSAVTSMPHNLKTGSYSKENFLDPSTEFTKNPIINLEKTTVGANENGNTGSVNDDEGYSVLANEIEEKTVDLETFNTTHLMGDSELVTSSLKINANQQPEVFIQECESKSFEPNSCKTAHTPHRNKTIVECALEDVSSSSNFKKFSNVSEIIESKDKHYKDSVTISSACKSLPLDGSSEGLILNSGRETLEIQTELHSKKTNTEKKYSSFEEIHLPSSSKTVPKSAFKIKSASKISEEYALDKVFDKTHLAREKKCNKVMKIPQLIQNNKKSNKNNRSNNRSKSGKQVMFRDLKTTSPEFDYNHPCIKCYSEYPANHMDKKKVNKNHKSHSTHGKYLDRCDHFSQTCNVNAQRNPKSCHASSGHCHFPNNYCLPPFLFPRNDIFYKQWMFINNFSYFLSHVK
ncbi:unnamed protein product [Larinioides sclopetarius]|uniref:Uncharacterized protein n=1 Tax=Larinioides sclopetarius TaxID=280406 RepID=A0AAV2BRN1_9ARAC